MKLLSTLAIFVLSTVLCLSNILSTGFTESIASGAQESSADSRKVVFFAKKGHLSLGFCRDRILVFKSSDDLSELSQILLNASNETILLSGGEAVDSSLTYNELNPNGLQIHTFSSIIYKNLNPGLDLKCEMIDNSLHFFVIQPGTIPIVGQHSLIFENFNCLQQSPTTVDLVQPHSGASFQYSIEPASFQTCSLLPTSSSNVFKLLIDNLQPSRLPDSAFDEKTVLSGILSFSSFLGGDSDDSVVCASPSSSGLLVCGSTKSTSFPTSSGVSQTTKNAGTDAFVCLFDSSGHKLWSTYLGASGDDIALGCASNLSKAYVVGRTSSTAGFSTSGSVQSQYAGGPSDGFVCSLDLKTGQKTSLSYLGGTDADELHGVSCSSNGDCAVVGSTTSTDMTMTGHQKQLNGNQEAFVVVLNPELTAKRWSSYYGGRGDEQGQALGSLSDGSVIMAGNTTSPNSGQYIAANTSEGLSMPGGLQTTGFIVRFDSQGNRVWGRYLGGDSFDTINCMQVVRDNIYVAGSTNSRMSGFYPNNGVSSGSFQSIYGGGAQDGFVTKLTSNGQRVWGSFIGGSGDDRCLGISVTPTDNVIVCGSTNSADFPLVQSEQKSIRGLDDAFVTYFLKDGSTVPASVILGGSNVDYAAGNMICEDASILFAGSTYSSDFPTANPTQSSKSGGSDVFVTKTIPLYVVGVDKQQELVNNVVINPQPATEFIRINSLDGAQIQAVTIRSLEGKIVYLNNNSETDQSMRINIQAFASGTYIAEVSTSHGFYHYSFLILH